MVLTHLTTQISPDTRWSGRLQALLEKHTGRTEDTVEKCHRELNERALLHVTATRAIKLLHISTNSEPNPFLGG
ncbi:hypothetical protein [Billgrantia bachuensis]|uniref:Uncharacterized protein n=1 Tax=Billgrantia bachuensis TaxID=2717286 RepID=A0ABX0PUN7_9GAMM|nr:hypothetical protein [Halomonas bachuensis]NIC07147.1 hypothetical protein [Halomonas bachuensis]